MRDTQRYPLPSAHSLRGEIAPSPYKYNKRRSQDVKENEYSEIMMPEAYKRYHENECRW